MLSPDRATTQPTEHRDLADGCHGLHEGEVRRTLSLDSPSHRIPEQFLGRAVRDIYHVSGSRRLVSNLRILGTLLSRADTVEEFQQVEHHGIVALVGAIAHAS